MGWKSLFANRVDATGHSDVVNILKLAERPEAISFDGGFYCKRADRIGGNGLNFFTMEL